MPHCQCGRVVANGHARCPACEDQRWETAGKIVTAVIGVTLMAIGLFIGRKK